MKLNIEFLDYNFYPEIFEPHYLSFLYYKHAFLSTRKTFTTKILCNNHFPKVFIPRCDFYVNIFKEIAPLNKHQIIPYYFCNRYFWSSRIICHNDQCFYDIFSKELKYNVTREKKIKSLKIRIKKKNNIKENFICIEKKDSYMK